MNDTAYSSVFHFRLVDGGVLEKLKRFATFEDNWSYSTEGKSFSTDTLESAKKIYKYAIDNTIYKTDFFPGLDGEIMVTLYWKDNYMEFIVKDNNILECLYEQGDTEILHEENINFSDAEANISKMREKKWSMLELLTQNTGTLNEGNSKALFLENSTGEYQYSTESVPKTHLQVYASI